ncbi:MAG: flagellar assembly peptidoglycan hydrolase FlgJ [Gammaproteobacteria bacterium]|nr:MAG: flagellar assembly peptidoglycan hydrolase FlgJ [Gammaproteobacteria bacterium]
MSINSTSNYFDYGALKELKRDTVEGKNEAIKTVAREFESMFVQQVLKSMRDASMGDDLFGSNAEDQYRDLFDKQISIDISSGGGKGFGIAAMIEKQIMQQHGLGKHDPNGKLKFDPVTYFGAPKGYAITRNQSSELETGDRSQLSAMKKIDGNNVVCNNRGLPDISEKGGKRELFASPDEFVKELLPQAKKAAEELGVDPKVLVAQAALETGWGKHVIHQDNGDKGFNFFGIKSHRDWNGDAVKVPTLEFESGVAKRKVDSFRVYESAEQSFSDYIDFLKSNPRYRQALQNSDDPDKFTSGLQDAGYATDPEYAEKIMRVYNSEQLRNISA